MVARRWQLPLSIADLAIYQKHEDGEDFRGGKEAAGSQPKVPHALKRTIETRFNKV